MLNLVTLVVVHNRWSTQIVKKGGKLMGCHASQTVKKGGQLMGCHASHGRAGRLFLNGTCGIHIYFDSETAVDQEIFEKCESSRRQQTPPIFHCYCGQTYTFQLKLGEFNFTSKHYTISRIVTEQQCAQLPKFVIHEDNHGSDDDKPEEKPVALKGSSSYQNAVAEVAGGVTPKVRERRNDNHQPSLYVGPAIVHPAASSLILDPNESGKKGRRTCKRNPSTTFALSKNVINIAIGNHCLDISNDWSSGDDGK
ncbi:unnamed protein product [Eruca vesicaria subsp. sativa]|uniref:Uncharacterized protein n=1 Tax=Eruca vesicaria subsp. sativa TaxID=29727 RepID=A0ABC8L6V3_ERUVS|nr:unnamed protein product [Eruca vesicaria subsp. sativa]